MPTVAPPKFVYTRDWCSMCHQKTLHTPGPDPRCVQHQVSTIVLEADVDAQQKEQLA